MKISSDKFTLECSYEELWILGIALIRQITDKFFLENYWSSLGIEKWHRVNAQNMALAYEISKTTGNEETYKGMIQLAEDNLLKFIAERKQSNKVT